MKEYFDADGNFEGKVYKSTNLDNPEYLPSTIKAIEGKSYLSFVGYIGNVVQRKNSAYYKFIIEQIHWMPAGGIQEKEEIITSTNLFLNVPSLSTKRKVIVASTNAPENVKVEYDEYGPESKYQKLMNDQESQ